MKDWIVQKYLDVPYKDKEIAKERGARFDMSVKRWYVPEGVNTFLFKRWIPKGKSFEKRRKDAMKKFLEKKGQIDSSVQYGSEESTHIADILRE